MYLLLISLPLMGTIITALSGRWMGNQGASMITMLSMTFSFILSMIAFMNIGLNQSMILLRMGQWLTLESTTMYWGFLFDSLTCVSLMVVTSISTLVHMYSTEYSANDPHLPRFSSYLSFFTFFSLILVTAENLIQSFVGWEGVGLCSYLLINFWYGRIQANKSAMKASVSNRMGDLGLSMGMFMMYCNFYTLDYSMIFASAQVKTNVSMCLFETAYNLFDFMTLFLFMGAVGKSAQVGLHTWLPDASEGPTPVSALIHAATSVTAGVFLLCRCSPLMEYASNFTFYMTLLGGMTAFLAATTGLLQNDMKRVMAYSTCSQLGYSVFAAGLSGYSVSSFHLANHAFFKALLFLSAGSVIHASADEQDSRKSGGLMNILPLTYVAMLMGSLALSGFPFLTGFYSKDIMLELAYGSFTIEGRFVHTLGILAAFFTAYYSLRLLSLVFLRPANGLRVHYEFAHEGGWPSTFPLIILTFASMFMGYLSRDLSMGLGSDFWGNSLFVLPSKQYSLPSEWLPTYVKLYPLLFSCSGAGLALVMYTTSYLFSLLYIVKLSIIGKNIYIFFNRKWFFDKMYNDWMASTLLYMSYNHSYQMLDRGMLEMVGPKGISLVLNNNFNKLNDISFDFVNKKLYLSMVALFAFLFMFNNILFMDYNFSMMMMMLLYLIMF